MVLNKPSFSINFIDFQLVNLVLQGFKVATVQKVVFELKYIHSMKLLF